MGGKLTDRAILVWTLLFFIFVYAPLAVLVIFSFDNSLIFTLPLRGFTLLWYERLFSNALLMSAIYNSFLVAAGVTVLSTLGGILGSFAVVRYRFRGRNVFNYIVLMPLVIPTIIMGVSLLVFFH